MTLFSRVRFLIVLPNTFNNWHIWINTGHIVEIYTFMGIYKTIWQYSYPNNYNGFYVNKDTKRKK